MRYGMRRGMTLWMCLVLVFVTLGAPGWAGAEGGTRREWKGEVNITSDETIPEGVWLTGDTTLTISEGVVLTVQNGIDLPESGTYDLIINGPGKLVVSGNEEHADYGDIAIQVEGLTVRGGATVEATALCDTGDTCAIWAKAFDGDGTIESLRISGSKVTAVSKRGIAIATHGVTITDGAEVTAIGNSGDDTSGFGLNYEGDLTVTDSTLYCKGAETGTGISTTSKSDKNTKITIQNSVVTAIGGDGENSGPGDGWFCNLGDPTAPFKYTFDITGGSLVKAVGGSGVVKKEGTDIPAGGLSVSNTTINIDGESVVYFTGGDVEADDRSLDTSGISGSGNTINLTTGALYIKSPLNSSPAIKAEGGSFTLKTAAAGRGWYNAEETGEYKEFTSGTYNYEALSDYRSLAFRNHTHQFTYSAEGATLTAECNRNCDLTEEERTVTILAPEDLVWDGTAKEAGLSEGYSTTAFPDDITIVYYSGDTKLSGAPTDAGTYRAQFTLYGCTAKVEFTITKGTAAVTEAPAARTLTANGEELALVTAGKAEGGEMQYSMDGETWSAEIPTGVLPGDYTVYYRAAGDENHENSETGTVKVNIAAPAQGIKGNIKFPGLTEVPEALKEIYSTLEDLKQAMLLKLKINGVSAVMENTAFYDIELLVSYDGGTTWKTATEENFPDEGISVTLPYPEGTDQEDDFAVCHMFTIESTRLGTTVGGTETPKVTKTEDGLRFTLTGLSPVAVSWIKAAEPTATPTATPKATPTATPTVTPTPTPAPTAAPTEVPKTGDGAMPLGWLIMILVGIAGIAAVIVVRRRN